MGDDVNNEQVDFNWFVNSVIGFPIGLFKEGFPLFQSNAEFWKLNNLILLFFNTLIQSVGIVFVGKFIKRRMI